MTKIFNNAFFYYYFTNYALFALKILILAYIILIN